MKVTVFYIGSSLLAPLKNAEREINRDYKLGLQIAPHNFGSPLTNDEWKQIDDDLANTDVVFVIHVMDGENASKLIAALQRYEKRHHAVVVINCMPELMRRTRLGRLEISQLLDQGAGGVATKPLRSSLNLLATVGSWIGKQTKARRGNGVSHGRESYLKIADRLPTLLHLVPNAGALRDVKNYLYLFCYFLQPTPENIRSMVLYSLKHYVPDDRLRKKIRLPPPEHMPTIGIYHPESEKLFKSFAEYQRWYLRRGAATSLRSKGGVHDGKRKTLNLDPNATIGLLLMRPQVISKTTRHYDSLIRALESEGLSVVPAISTLMDNRKACQEFFVKSSNAKSSSDAEISSRVSQIVSLTGFSFVGGPAMNDSAAASDFLNRLNRPYRSAVSLDTQTLENWQQSLIGLNPIQAGMQVAIPEIDGATEPFVYGGLSDLGVEPVAIEERCVRYARRIKRWNQLRTAPRSEIKLALVLFCFPPGKGNIGTAADLDVFPSLWSTLRSLVESGYAVDLPDSAEELREQLIGGNSSRFGTTANICYRMKVDEYRQHCSHVDEIEQEWGAAPGAINSFGGELLVQGITLGNVFIGVQPTFGYEGDPMRLMMARSGAPHHGFMAFYTYLSRILNVHAVVHVGTHGAMEFMPGKQIGLSGSCWPDRLIGEMPNIYLYSVNNPSEGSIAKRRSYAELISYLTPPIESAGLYRELASLKDLLSAYRGSDDEIEKERLFETIEEASRGLNFSSRGA